MKRCRRATMLIMRPRTAGGTRYPCRRTRAPAGGCRDCGSRCRRRRRALQYVEQHATGCEQPADRRRRQQRRDHEIQSVESEAEDRDQQNARCQSVRYTGQRCRSTDRTADIGSRRALIITSSAQQDPGHVDDVEDQVQPEREQRQHRRRAGCRWRSRLPADRCRTCLGKPACPARPSHLEHTLP